MSYVGHLNILEYIDMRAQTDRPLSRYIRVLQRINPEHVVRRFVLYRRGEPIALVIWQVQQHAGMPVHEIDVMDLLTGDQYTAIRYAADPARESFFDGVDHVNR